MEFTYKGKQVKYLVFKDKDNIEKRLKILPGTNEIEPALENILYKTMAFRYLVDKKLIVKNQKNQTNQLTSKKSETFATKTTEKENQDLATKNVSD